MSLTGGRNRLAAVLLSALACPGAGQIYKRQYVKGGVLVFASLALVAALFVRTWTSMLELALSAPPEQILSDVFGLAYRIMEENSGFFTISGYLFLAVWLIGVLDAALSRAGAPGPGRSGG